VEEFFTAGPVWITALFVYLFTDRLKHIVPWLLTANLGQRILAVMPLVLGAAIGFVPDWLPGTNLSHRILAGATVGMLNAQVFNLVKKRPPAALELLDGRPVGNEAVNDSPEE